MYGALLTVDNHKFTNMLKRSVIQMDRTYIILLSGAYLFKLFVCVDVLYPVCLTFNRVNYLRYKKIIDKIIEKILPLIQSNRMRVV